MTSAQLYIEVLLDQQQTLQTGIRESLSSLMYKKGLTISAKKYIQNVIPKFESLFGKELKPVKTPMSEGYITLKLMTLHYALIKIQPSINLL
jgi:hypothetical protein